jgi:hypothetical protein
MADSQPFMIDCPTCNGGQNPPANDVCDTCNGMAKIVQL